MDGKTVVILQSNYIPWKGYFDLILAADEFIFYDDVQFTTGDWRNRNKIKTAEGTRWLTIPAGPDINRLICEVEIKDQEWKQQHRRTIVHHYQYAPCFKEYEYILDELYENDLTNLSEYNQTTVKYLAGVLGIKTTFSDSREYQSTGGKTERLVNMLLKAGARHFLCGPAARNYLDEPMIREAGIGLSYFDYSGYRPYKQLYGNFIHEVTVLDLIFNTGSEAITYLKSFKHGN